MGNRSLVRGLASLTLLPLSPDYLYRLAFAGRRLRQRCLLLSLLPLGWLCGDICRELVRDWGSGPISIYRLGRRGLLRYLRQLEDQFGGTRFWSLLLVLTRERPALFLRSRRWSPDRGSRRRACGLCAGPD